MAKRSLRYVMVAVFLALGIMLSGTRALATPVSVGGGWIAFCFGGPGSPAVAGGCVDTTFGNPFDWTSSIATVLSVTDAFLHGDTFNVLEGLVNILSTPFVAAGGSTCGAGGGFESDPNCAFADPLYSHGSVLLAAGSHSANIFAALSPFGGGEAFVRVDAVPEPTTLLLLGSGLVGVAFLGRKRFFNGLFRKSCG